MFNFLIFVLPLITKHLWLLMAAESLFNSFCETATVSAAYFDRKPIKKQRALQADAVFCRMFYSWIFSELFLSHLIFINIEFF